MRVEVGFDRAKQGVNTEAYNKPSHATLLMLLVVPAPIRGVLAVGIAMDLVTLRWTTAGGQGAVVGLRLESAHATPSLRW